MRAVAQHNTAALLLLVIVLALMASPIAFSTFSERPEGVDVQIYKVVYDGKEAVLGRPETYSYGNWKVRVPSNYNVIMEFLRGGHPSQKCYHGGECTIIYEEKDPTDVEVRVSLTAIRGLSGRFQSAPDFPIESGDRVIEWETREGSKIVKRKAVVVTADTWIEIRTIPNTGFDGVEGVYVWFVLRGISWRTFVEDPETPEGYRLQDVKGVFLPVLAYIKEAYEWAWVDSKDKSLSLIHI